MDAQSRAVVWASEPDGTNPGGGGVGNPARGDGRECSGATELPLLMEVMRTREEARSTVPARGEGEDHGPIGVHARPLFDANGEVRWVAFTALREAAHRKSHQDGRTREHFFRSLLDQAFDGVSLLNERGEMVFLSPSVKRILGYSEAELLGQPGPEYSPPEEKEFVWGKFADLLSDPGGILTLEWRMLHKDGHEVILEGIARNLLDDPSVGGIVLNYREVTQWRRAEEVVRDRDRKLIAVFRNAHLAIGLVSERTILDINEATCRLSGYSREELLGSKTAILYQSPAEAESLGRVLYRQIAETGVGAVNATLRRKDGTLRSVILSGSGVDPKRPGAGYLITFLDLTDQMRAERALSVCEAELHSIFRAAPIGIAATLKRVFVEANKKFCEMTGYSREELIGSHARMLYPTAEEADRIGAMYEEIQASGLGSVETVWRRKDGSLINILLNSTAITPEKPDAEITVTATDITKRKRAEEALRESEALYRTLVENMQDVLYRTDCEGRITLTTPSAPALLGYDRVEDLYGTRVADLYADASQRGKLLEVLAEKGSVKDYEVTLVRKDGTPVFISTSSHFIYDNSGQVLGVEGVYHDITERKRAEEVIRRSEEKYRLLVETANSIILRLNRHGRVTFCNDFAQRFFGYTEEELLGREATDTILPDKSANGQDFQEFMEDLFVHPEHHLTHENENRCRNGERVWVAWANKPIRDGAGDVVEFLCVGNDVTAHKRLEEDYRGLFEGAPIGIYRTTPDGRILRANPAMVRMLGFDTAEDLATRNLEEVGFDPDDPRASFKKDLEAGGEVKAREGRWIAKDGRTVFVRENAKLCRTFRGETYFDGTVEDVTDSRQRQEMLQVMAKAIEFSRLGITLTDREGRITFTNAASASMLGYEVADLLGKNMRIFAPTRLWKPRNIEELGSYDRESVNIRKDGTEIPVWLSSDVVCDDAGAAVGIVTICEDLTERKHQEAMIENARRMEFMGRLVAGVAHEVRNPLNAIQVTTSVLKREMEDNPDQRQLLDLIEDEVDRLAQLTRDLLELGKPPDPGRFRVHSLRELCDVAVENWGHTNPEQARRALRRVDAVAGDDWVMADALKIQQAIINLLDNALQHSPPGGEITLGLREEENFLRISVSDRGAGIPTALIGRVFDPFFTTRQGGTGLGLPIVKATAENHGGAASLWNEDPPPGCTGEIVLPKHRQSGDEP